jgi:hypothetical protein
MFRFIERASVTIADTCASLSGFSVRSITKERSIFSVSSGSVERQLSEEKPVPKSSIAMLTPIHQNHRIRHDREKLRYRLHRPSPPDPHRC